MFGGAPWNGGGLQGLMKGAAGNPLLKKLSTQMSQLGMKRSIDEVDQDGLASPSALVAKGGKGKFVKAEFPDSTPGNYSGGKGKHGGGAPGYVFLCSNETEVECQNLHIFGAPDKEFSQLMQAIKPETQLFLLNFEKLMLTGPFVAVEEPSMYLAPGAFGGKFNAQVRVAASSECPLLEVQLGSQVPQGPLTQADVANLRACLQQTQGPPPGHGQAKRHKGKGKGGALATDLCWDFVKGSCRRGERCSYKHEGEGDCAGYVFLCNDQTQGDCEAYQLFGAPERDLHIMKHCITPETPLFLLNYQSKTLMGAFRSTTQPETGIAKEAFNGKFTAQICVTPWDAEVLKCQLPSPIHAGSKTAAEVADLEAKLKAGGE